MHVIRTMNRKVTDERTLFQLDQLERDANTSEAAAKPDSMAA